MQFNTFLLQTQTGHIIFKKIEFSIPSKVTISLWRVWEKGLFDFFLESFEVKMTLFLEEMVEVKSVLLLLLQICSYTAPSHFYDLHVQPSRVEC